MSWDASLHCNSCDHGIGWWNYTHNTNGMANAVLDPNYDTTMSVGQEVLGLGGTRPRSWWENLDGLSGPDGAALLNRIIDGLNADLDRFKAMNPGNGWGDLDGFLKVLTEMRDAVPETPTTWHISG